METYRQKFIREFCNDHNPPVIRWLRGQFYDETDKIEQILVFLDGLQPADQKETTT